MFGFWNSKARNLAQVFDSKALSTGTSLLRQTSETFERHVQKEIQRLDLSRFNENNQLLKETLIELTSLLEQQTENWENLNIDDVTSLLPELLKASRWKLEVFNYNYSIEKTTELTNAGMQVLPALNEMLPSFLNNNPDLKITKLVQKYLQDSPDNQEIIVRMLRCVVTLIKNPTHFKQTIFAWNRHYQLKLKSRLAEPYLYDQLRLFAFMAKNDNDALPIKELRAKLQQFVQIRLAQQEQAKQPPDIVHDVLLHLFEKRADYTNQNFFVDKKLEYYIMDLAKNRSELRKNRYKQNIIQNENTLDERSHKSTEEENLAEIIEILKNCIHVLDTKCKKMIHTRYLGDYAEILSYEAVAAFLNESPKTIEKRGRSCNKILKDCVTLKSNQRGLRPY